jgi:hypothetical protein
MTTLEPLHNRDRQLRRRLGPLREIVLARALYRCGDYEGLGKTILEEYKHDVRGLFARHAASVLDTTLGWKGDNSSTPKGNAVKHFEANIQARSASE